MKEIKTKTELEDLVGTVIIDFWAPWCGPCVAVAPELEKLAEEGFSVVKINVDESPDLAQQFDVMSIPTLILLQDGEAVRRAVGAMNAESIKQKLGV